jgi:hypothetical protein
MVSVRGATAVRAFKLAHPRLGPLRRRELRRCLGRPGRSLADRLPRRHAIVADIHLHRARLFCDKTALAKAAP